MIIREIKPEDREEYLKMSAEFYSSPAVLADIPASYREGAFEEYVRGTHAKCFILEEDGKYAGYGIVAFLYMQEAGDSAHSSTSCMCANSTVRTGSAGSISISSLKNIPPRSTFWRLKKKTCAQSRFISVWAFRRGNIS